MRCPDCCKFVGLETEVEDVDVDTVTEERGEVTLSITASVVRNCAECGQELKRGEFETEVTTLIPESERECKGEIAADAPRHHDINVEVEDEEPVESGGGRYAKNMVGFSASYKVTCGNRGCSLALTGDVEDSMAASNFDESV